MSNFINDCINGDALLDDIDDYIAKWHEDENEEEIYNFLGMTQEEYFLWLEDGFFLKFIVIAHETNCDVNSVLVNHSDLRLVARATDSSEAKKIYDWLRERGKIQ